jgi:hypothetical protein
MDRSDAIGCATEESGVVDPAAPATRRAIHTASIRRYARILSDPHLADKFGGMLPMAPAAAGGTSSGPAAAAPQG